MYTILVTDDDPIVRGMLNQILTMEGYTLSFATTVKDGYTACLQNKPDLILLDVNLPDGSGVDLCRRIKAEQKVRHIPILLLTGEAVDAGCRTDGLEAGADDYILKPFDRKELILRIKRILG
ncbi:MAG: hypothetical protein A3J79_01620 [Elusimicrobia bacterium RIFOXYB2_FULL_62_6]|nr:MAG: hypothetical protein A3J79_01620 [Elusimicrobia bacterium RIFOXYB2_FULL_62_6]